MMTGRVVRFQRNAHDTDGDIPGSLVPGQVDIRHFRLLMTLGRIKKQNMQGALEDVLVRGASRGEACERHGVSQSQFSVKYRQLQVLSQTVVRIYPFIMEGPGDFGA
ncbi:PapB/FocB family fimbrial expression transcriptional regulator [Citrobacter meridianamericanus]|uniref:PapB/FocB family fimbrial expression transcriptional regulator n=1 Tax=Citrobacter meridianamericanus TaxID=2894201 RepID=UPI0039BE7D6F